jgi:actin-related protein 6
MVNNSVIVLDNGAATIKAGIANQRNEKVTTEGPRIIPNAVVRSKGDKFTYFGHELDRCKDYSSLHYRLPFEKVRRTAVAL